MGRWKRAERVARWFGVEAAGAGGAIAADLLDQLSCALRDLLPKPGQILLIAGASGSGKSTLLRKLRGLLRGRCVELDRIELRRRPVIELFGVMELGEALALLSRFGLAEAHTYLLPPRKLSAGQQWRLRLALALAEAQRRKRRRCIVADEFANPLDRITAAIVAHALRRMIDRTCLSAIVATTRDDLRRALRPEKVLECDFGQARLIATTGRSDTPVRLRPKLQASGRSARSTGCRSSARAGRQHSLA
jgi:ABC-type ATPase with predicted acetyltransferase domain